MPRSGRQSGAVHFCFMPPRHATEAPPQALRSESPGTAVRHPPTAVVSPKHDEHHRRQAEHSGRMNLIVFVPRHRGPRLERPVCPRQVVDLLGGGGISQCQRGHDEQPETESREDAGNNCEVQLDVSHLAQHEDGE